MSKKRNDKESMSCLTLKQSQSFCLPYTKQRKKFTEKEIFKEKWVWGIGCGGLNLINWKWVWGIKPKKRKEKKRKGFLTITVIKKIKPKKRKEKKRKGFLTIKKDPTTSIREFADKLKVDKKTVDSN